VTCICQHFKSRDVPWSWWVLRHNSPKLFITKNLIFCYFIIIKF
jgi:hypothetical protein